MAWRDTQKLVPEPNQRHHRGITISNGTSLLWLLGMMALILCGVGLTTLLLPIWSNLELYQRLLCYSLMVSLPWLGYGIFAKLGIRSGEVLGLLLSISWLLSLLCVREILPTIPLWMQGLIFLGGSMLITALHPVRITVATLGLASIVLLVLLGYTLHQETDVSSWALLWGSTLSTIMVWGLSGGWCAVTLRRGYHSFAAIGPVCFALLLVCYQAILLYPARIYPEPLHGHLSQWEWTGLMLMWALPMLFLLRIQYRRARRAHHGFFSLSFVLYYLTNVIALPTALLSLERSMTAANIGFLLWYGAVIIYYGIYYRLPYFVMLGCFQAFLTAFGVTWGDAATPETGAAVMLLTASLFLAVALLLARQRDDLLKSGRNRQLLLQKAADTAAPSARGTVSPEADVDGSSVQAPKIRPSQGWDAAAVLSDPQSTHQTEKSPEASHTPPPQIPEIPNVTRVSSSPRLPSSRRAGHASTSDRAFTLLQHPGKGLVARQDKEDTAAAFTPAALQEARRRGAAGQGQIAPAFAKASIPPLAVPTLPPRPAAARRSPSSQNCDMGEHTEVGQSPTLIAAPPVPTLPPRIRAAIQAAAPLPAAPEQSPEGHKPKALIPIPPAPPSLPSPPQVAPAAPRIHAPKVVPPRMAPPIPPPVIKH